MEPLPLPSSPLSGYSDGAGLVTRRRCYRRDEVGVSLGGSARWSIDAHKKINWKKSESHEDETREHVVLLLCKLTPQGELSSHLSPSLLSCSLSLSLSTASKFILSLKTVGFSK